MIDSPLDLRPPPPDDSGTTLLAGAGVLISIALSLLDFGYLLANAVGDALVASPSDQLPPLLLSIAILVISTAAMICGQIAARRGRRLGRLWSIAALLPLSFGLISLLLTGIQPSTQ